MKKARFLSAAALLSLFAPLALAEPSGLSVRVEQATSVDAARFKKTQEKSLKIFLTNGSSADMEKLKVKYYFFGHGTKDNEAEVLDSGVRGASVKAHATETVETPAAKATMTEEHYDSKQTRATRNQPSRVQLGKKIGASGEKFTGYGVRVYEGEKVLAEYFSEPSLAEKAGR